MGLSYYVHTPEDAASRLPRPDRVPAAFESRYPTLREVKRVLESLDGYSSDGKRFARARWAAHVKKKAGGSGTLVHFDSMAYSRERHRGPVWFEKGDTELIVDIVERLTHTCGPLILTCDADLGEKPLVVAPGMTVEEALAPWRMPPGGWKVLGL